MSIESQLTNHFMNLTVQNRIVEAGVCVADQTSERVKSWQENGHFVVANAGAFDVLGLNHLRGLMQARIIGAAYRLGGASSPGMIYALASSDEIRLVVSLDTNEAIADNKAFREAHGSSPRPLLDWETRARTLALQAFGGKHDLVDLITRHGPNACSECDADSCVHSSTTYNIASSGADLTIIKSHDRPTFERYPDNLFHVIDETDGAFFDAVLDSQISTTALVKRARMER